MLVILMVCKIPKELEIQIGHKFEGFEAQLKTKTNTPEEVDAIKQAMVTIPIKSNELYREIEALEVKLSTDLHHTYLYRNMYMYIYIYIYERK